MKAIALATGISIAGAVPARSADLHPETGTDDPLIFEPAAGPGPDDGGARKQDALARAVSVRPCIGAVVDHAASPVRPAHVTDDPWWPDTRLPERSLIPPPAYGNFANRTEPAEIVACLVPGLRGRDLEAAFAAVVDKLRGDGRFKPIFVTDCDGLVPIVREGFVAEHVSPADGSESAADAPGLPARPGGGRGMGPRSQPGGPGHGAP